MERSRRTFDDAAYRSGSDAELFSSLYDRYVGAIRLYCLRRVGRSDVDDAVSEVFGVAWRRIDQVPADGTELYWLYGVARNAIRNIDRSGRRRSRLIARLASLAWRPEPAAEVQIVRSEEARVVLAALRSLREGDQEILRLRMWEELDRHAIGAIFGISPEAADMRINRATKRMAHALRRSGVAEYFEQTPSTITEVHDE